MSAEPIETAVTGKPMDHYEPYVEMLSQVLANGLALTTDREFLLGLDRTVPLREAVRDAARDSIKWRFAFEIDRIEAAHDAEVRAGVVTEEPEWEVEYGVRGDVDSPMSSRDAAEHAIERMAKGPRGYRIIRSLVERRVSPWVPVKQEGATDADPR